MWKQERVWSNLWFNLHRSIHSVFSGDLVLPSVPWDSFTWGNMWKKEFFTYPKHTREKMCECVWEIEKQVFWNCLDSVTVLVISLILLNVLCPFLIDGKHIIHHNLRVERRPSLDPGRSHLLLGLLHMLLTHSSQKLSGILWGSCRTQPLVSQQLKFWGTKDLVAHYCTQFFHTIFWRTRLKCIPFGVWFLGWITKHLRERETDKSLDTRSSPLPM